MNETQYELLLSAVCISANPSMAMKDASLKASSHGLLEQFKSGPQSKEQCLSILSMSQPHVYKGEGVEGGSGSGVVDCTIHMQLYCVHCLRGYCLNTFAKLSAHERSPFREQLMTLLAMPHMANAEGGRLDKSVVNNVASLLASVTALCFPDSWPTFLQDTGSLLSISSQTAVICLLSLKQAMSDCKDNDFNSSLSSTARNAFLQGLNEVSESLLTLLYDFALHSYNTTKPPSNQPTSLTLQVLSTLESFCLFSPPTWFERALPDDRSYLKLYLHLMTDHKDGLATAAAKCFSAMVR